MSGVGKLFEVVNEEIFEDKKEPGKTVSKVLVYVKMKDGMLRTMAFPKSKYGLSTRDKLITDYLTTHNLLPK